MSIVFNPISGQFDYVGAGGGSIYFSDPVATESDLPGTDQNGTARVCRDTDFIYIFDGDTNKWRNTGVKVTSLGSTPNDGGLSIGTDTTGNILSISITLQPADATHPGAITASNQTIGGEKTFQDGIKSNSILPASGSEISIGTSGTTVNIYGTLNKIQTTNTEVVDKLITLNDGGIASSGDNSGVEIEEDGVITAYAKTSNDRNSWDLKAPNTTGIATITPGVSGITLNQSSHDPVTLGTTNGLSLAQQQLSLGTSSASTTGALTSTDWSTFNAKQNNIFPVTNQRVYVNYLAGSDVTGDGTYANPYKTVKYALTTITDATINKPYTVFLGAGRQIETGDVFLKPYTFIVGDVQRSSYLRINGGSLKPDTSFSTSGGWTGIAELYLDGSTQINWDLQAVGGSSNCVFLIQNCTVTGSATFTGRTGGGGDFLESYVGLELASLNLDSTYWQVQSIEIGGTVNITNSQAVAMRGTFRNVCFDSNVTIDATGGAITTYLEQNNFCGAGNTLTTIGTVNIECDSRALPPKNLQILSVGTNITFKDDISNDQYTPTTPSDWSVTPSTSQDALDTLAGDVKTNTDDIAALEISQIAESNTGFESWGSGTTYYTITGGALRIDRSGSGYINGTRVTWTAPQTTTAFSPNTLNYVYIDSTGTIGSTTSTTNLFENYIVLFEVLYDGTNYVVAKENHPYSINTRTSRYLHNNVGSVIRGTGAIITRVTTGTGALSTDRQVQIVGSDIYEDHGLETTIPDSAGTGVTWNVYYTNASGKWVRYAQQQELPMFYNNGGTPTALSTGATSDIGIYVLYVSKDDLNSSTPLYYAVMNNATFNIASQATTAINNGTIARATNELLNLELAQLGYAIVDNGVAGGEIVSLIISKSSFNSVLVGGGNQGSASLISLNTTNFNGGLSASDTNVQVALDTLDNKFTPSDINPSSFGAANNQLSPANVTGFSFNNSTTRAFDALVSVYINATTPRYETFKLQGIQRSGDWDMNVIRVGDASGINFSITNSGQIQYVSSDYTGFVSATIRFRAIALSI